MAANVPECTSERSLPGSSGNRLVVIRQAEMLVSIPDRNLPGSSGNRLVAVPADAVINNEIETNSSEEMPVSTAERSTPEWSGNRLEAPAADAVAGVIKQEVNSDSSEEMPVAITDLSVGSLVEDCVGTTLTPFVAEALKSFIERHDKSSGEIIATELLLVIISLIALECGFVPHGCRYVNRETPRTAAAKLLRHYPTYDRRLVHAFHNRFMPSGWYHPASRSYQVQWDLANFEAPSSTLVALRSGDSLILTFTVPGRVDLPSASIYLPVSRYVPTVPLHSGQIQHCVQYLKELSMKLKNELFLKVRNGIVEDGGLMPYPALYGMPDELVNKIESYLSVGDASRLWMTLRRRPMPPGDLDS